MASNTSRVLSHTSGNWKFSVTFLLCLLINGAVSKDYETLKSFNSKANDVHFSETDIFTETYVSIVAYII